MKVCGHCKKELPLLEFGLVHNKPRSECRSCRTEYQRQYRLTHYDRYLEVKRKSYHKHKERNKPKRRNEESRRRYGITRDEYHEFFIKANYKCEICGNPATCLDHCHETNTNRGVLCSRCNLLIGQMEENVSFLRSAADYLEEAKR